MQLLNRRDARSPGRATPATIVYDRNRFAGLSPRVQAVRAGRLLAAGARLNSNSRMRSRRGGAIGWWVDWPRFQEARCNPRDRALETTTRSSSKSFANQRSPELLQATGRARYRPLARSLARRYKGGTGSRSRNIVQVAELGLVKAIQVFVRAGRGHSPPMRSRRSWARSSATSATGSGTSACRATSRRPRWRWRRRSATSPTSSGASRRSTRSPLSSSSNRRRSARRSRGSGPFDPVDGRAPKRRGRQRDRRRLDRLRGHRATTESRPTSRARPRS